MRTLLVLLCLLATTAQAADRCLDPSGGSDAASGTATGGACTGTVSPWQTFAKYTASAVVGETLYIKAGTTYTQANNADRLTLKGNVDRYGAGANPVINGAAIVVTSNWFNGQVEAVNRSNITIKNLEVKSGGAFGIYLNNCTTCVVDSVTVRDKSGDTGSFITIYGGSVTVRNSHLYNSYVTPPNYGAMGVQIANVSSCLVEDNFIHDAAGAILINWAGGAGPTHNCLLRRNSVMGVASDPILYMSAATDAEVTQNWVMIKDGPPDRGTSEDATIAVSMEGHAGSGPNRNVRVHHNILGWTYGWGFTSRILKDVGNSGPNERLLSFVVFDHNTVVKSKCTLCVPDPPFSPATDGGADIYFIDNRPAALRDATDIDNLAVKDNLLWAHTDHGTNTFKLVQGITTAQVTIDHNFVQQANFKGAITGTNLTQTNTVPFISFDNNVLRPFGNPQNLNLTATTTARTAATDGGAVGALDPPRLQSITIANTAPTTARLVFSTPYPISSCTHTLISLSGGLTVTGCTVVNNTIVDVAFTGTVTAGQSLTATLSQRFVESLTVGCGTAACQAFTVVGCSYCIVQTGTRRNETFAKAESYAYTNFPVTNQVQSGCSPIVTSCIVPDSASDDHVLFQIATCGSSPVLPASGVTGFVITEQDAGTKTCSTFTRTGSTDQLDCDTTAITTGKTVTWTYGQAAAAGPTTAELDNCNGAENPMTTGWSSGIDSDDPNGMQELTAAPWCVKSTLNGAGTGSAYRASGPFGPDSEMWGVYGDASHNVGLSELHVRIQNAGTAIPSSYACRVTYGTNPLTIEIIEYTNGTPATLATGTLTLNNNEKMLCRIVGTTLTMAHSTGTTWTSVLSTTDGTITGAGHIGVRSTTGNIAYDSLGGGTYTAGGAGNVTNSAAAPLPTSAGSCTNNVAAPPAAPVIVDIRLNASNAQQILGTWDALGGTMTLNGGGCNGFTCTQNGTNFPLASCAVTTSPVIALTTTTPMSAGNTYACSYAQAGGNVTNGTTEIAAFTNTPVLNTLVPSTVTRAQYSWRVHAANEPGPPSTGSGHWLGPADTGIAVAPGGMVLPVFGFRVTGDQTPNEALAVRCQDNGGAAYQPDETFSGHLVRYTTPTPTVYTDLQVIGSRPLAAPGSSVYDGDGRIATQRGSFPARVRLEDTDSVMAPILQVTANAVDGDVVGCYLVTDDGGEMTTYTPAKTTPLVTVRTKMARGF